MLAAQHLVATLQSSHPSHKVVTRPPGPRSKKASLQSSVIDDVRRYLVNGSVPPGELGQVRNHIHTTTVSFSEALNTPCPLLGIPPPKVHESELSLPRTYRSTLAQLRSTHCTHLNSYQYKIGKILSPLCPDCGIADHSVSHLFQCNSNHTTLTVADLWHNPRCVARFISSLQRPPERPPPWPSP